MFLWLILCVMQNKGTYICGMEKFGLFFAEELKQRKRIVPLLLENTVGKSSADADFKKKHKAAGCLSFTKVYA